MSNIPRLSKQSEELISSALSAVTERTNSGESPNDAIVKVASDKGITAGHVRLMVRAFNNGRSLGHIREHSGLHEKAASFSLADAGEILERMFPSKIPTQAEKQASVAVGSDYSRSPQAWLKRRAGGKVRTEMVKTAAAATPKQRPASAYEYRDGRKALSNLADIRREHDRVKDAAIKAAYKVAADVSELGEYFRRPDALPAAEVATNAAYMYGEPANKLVTHAGAMQKSARVANRARPVDWNATPYSLIKQALSSMTDFTMKRASLDTHASGLAEKKAEELRPFGLGLENVITGSLWDNQSQIEKQAVGLFGLGLVGATGGMARGMAQKMSPKTREDLVQDRLFELSSPQHEDKLRAIRVRTMLHELMNSDPIISGYDPQEVLEAYNHLAEVSPQVMQQRITAQGLLRKYLEQASALDAFDANEMLSVEKGITERNSPKALSKTHQTGAARELGPAIGTDTAKGADGDPLAKALSGYERITEKPAANGKSLAEQYDRLGWREALFGGEKKEPEEDSGPGVVISDKRPEKPEATEEPEATLPPPPAPMDLDAWFADSNADARQQEKSDLEQGIFPT